MLECWYHKKHMGMGYGRRKHFHQCVGKRMISKLKKRKFRCPGNLEAVRQTLYQEWLVCMAILVHHILEQLLKGSCSFTSKIKLVSFVEILIFFDGRKASHLCDRGRTRCTMHLFLYRFPLNILFIFQLHSYFIWLYSLPITSHCNILFPFPFSPRQTLY